MNTSKQLREKLQVWAHLAGFATERSETQTEMVWLEKLHVGTYGRQAYRVVVIGDGGGQATPFGEGYLTASEMLAALSFAISTLYVQTRRPALRVRERA